MRERAIALHHADKEIGRYLSGLHRRSERLSANLDSVTILLPQQVAEWHQRRDYRHPSRSETVPGILRRDLLRAPQWTYVTDTWGPSLRFLDAQQVFESRAVGDFSDDLSYLARASRRSLSEPFEPHISTLPSLWVWVGRGLIETADPPRQLVEKCVYWAKQDLSGDRKATSRVQRQLAEQNLIVVRVSNAGYNTRFRGELVTDKVKAWRALLHLAAALHVARGA
jgi:hypothetical protein